MFELNPPDPIITFGPYAGKHTDQWPTDYLERMYELALNDRIMDRNLANHIIKATHKRRHNG